MKKMLLFIAVVMSITSSFSATIRVRVSNFQFSPKRVNAVVGDRIKFVWVNGTHTATSTSVPAGAATWNSPINSTSTTFIYVITKPGTYRYRCNIHPTQMTGVINVTNALSAGLTDFEIDQSESDKAVINWKTGSDKDIAFYSVQRSIDGENFTEIAKINPAGSLDATQLHHYVDNNITNRDKYVYYMLEMVDTKGNRQLSDIKMFTQKAKAAHLIASLSPNPISRPGHLMMQFNSDNEGRMLVQLFSENGNLVKQTEMTAVKGVNNGHFHLGDITPGTYYIVCSIGSIKEKRTIIVK